MALVKCKECGNEVSKKAKTCPHCGAGQGMSTGRKLINIVGGLFILFILIAIVNSSGTKGTTKPKAGVALPSFGEQLVTFEEFNRIQNGMTYEQVKGIIGEEGEEMSSNEIAGIKNIMFQWVNSNGSNMNAMFQDNKLIQKAQFGLK